MILNIFTVYDEKAHAYLPPFFMPRIEQAIRVFTDCTNSEDHQFGKHPHDYTLFHSGEFDDNSCKFLITTPKSLHNGVELVSVQTSLETSHANQISDDSQVLTGAESGNSA